MVRTARYILIRVLIGIAIATAMLWVRKAHAIQCPFNQPPQFEITARNPPIGQYAAANPLKCSIGNRFTSPAEFQAACHYTVNTPLTGSNNRFIWRDYSTCGFPGPNASQENVTCGQSATDAQNNVGASYSYTLTSSCKQAVCPTAGSPYGLIVKAGSAAGAQCDTTVHQGCELTSTPYTVISATPGGSYSSFDLTYTGRSCGTPTDTPPPSESVTVQVSDPPQLFKLTRGSYSTVKWVTAATDVGSTVTETNASRANLDGGIVQQSGSPVSAPSPAASPIVVTFMRDGQRVVNLYPAESITQATNLTNVRAQSGGPEGGRKPAGQPTTTTSTRVEQDGTRITTTTTFGDTSNTTTVVITPPASSNTPPTTTTTTRPNTPGEPPSESAANRTSPRPESPPNYPPAPPDNGGGGGGGKPDGDTNGTGDGDEGDGEGDCTGDDCGNGGGGGGEGAFEGKGGTARTFAESSAVVSDAFGASPLATKVRALQIPSGGSCPAPAIPMPYLNKTITMDAHCTVAEGIRGPLRAVFLAVWVIVAIGVFLRP